MRTVLESGFPGFSFRPREERKEDMFFRILECDDNEALIRLSPEKKSELLKYCFERAKNSNLFECNDEFSVISILSLDKHFKNEFEEFIKLSPVVLLDHDLKDIEALLRFISILEVRDIPFIKSQGPLRCGLNKIFVEDYVSLSTTSRRFNRFIPEENKWKFKTNRAAEKQFLEVPVEISQSFASACASESSAMIKDSYNERNCNYFNDDLLILAAYSATKADEAKRHRIIDFVVKSPSEILNEYGNNEIRDIEIIKRHASFIKQALNYSLVSIDQVRIRLAPKWEYKDVCHFFLMTEIAKDYFDNHSDDHMAKELLYNYHDNDPNFLGVEPNKSLLEELMVIGSISNLIYLENSEKYIEIFLDKLEGHIEYFNREYREIECMLERMIAGMDVLVRLSQNSKSILKEKPHLLTDVIRNILEFSQSEINDRQLEFICYVAKKLRKSERQIIARHLLNGKFKNDLLESIQEERSQKHWGKISEELN